MLEKLICVVIFLCLVSSNSYSQSNIQSDTTTYEHLIGVQRDSLHNSEKFYSYGGALVGLELPDKVKKLYSVKIFEVRDKDLLLFFVADKKNEQPDFIVKDQILLTKPSSEYRIATQMCTRNNEMDSSIIAVAKDEGGEELTKIIKAWKINYQKEKIIETDVKGIKCYKTFSSN